MSFQIGFVLLTHANVPQIRRLVGTLDRMFNEPPIVCHHDFAKCDLSRRAFASNFTFVEPHERTAWGRFSIVEATLRGIAALYARPNPPDWFVLLSAADYPIKSARTILDELSASPFDACVELREVSDAQRRVKAERLNFRRYRTFRFHVPALLCGETPQRFFTLEHPRLTRHFTPFSNDFRCFTGSQWFCANARATDYLLRWHRESRALADHYLRQEKYRPICPDESYIQTILGNAPDLRLGKDPLRYIDWSAGEAHPRTLTMADWPALTTAPAHFARKFDPAVDEGVLDRLDQFVVGR